MEPTTVALSIFIKEAIKPMAEVFLAFGMDTYKKSQVIFETCFTKYIERSYSRYSKTKTLRYREKPVDLKSFT